MSLCCHSVSVCGCFLSFNLALRFPFVLDKKYKQSRHTEIVDSEKEEGGRQVQWHLSVHQRTSESVKVTAESTSAGLEPSRVGPGGEMGRQQLWCC